MRLILLRHGTEVEQGEGLEDSDRGLSPKGRAILEENLPILSHYLASLKNCRVWTSPANCTVETADILTRYMAHTDYEIKGFIQSGSKKALIKALKKFDHQDTLLLVGHEPHLSDWVQHLTGRESEFQKGHFQMLYLAPDAPQDAVVLTRPELNQLHYLEPLELPVAVGMRLILRRQHDQIISSREHFLDDPDNATKLHALRINIRIAWSLLDYVKDWADRAAYKKAQKAYRALYDETNHLRDMDMLLKSIHDSRNWRFQPLATALMNERNAEALALTARLSSKNSQGAYYKAYELVLAMFETVETQESISETAHPQMSKRLAEISQSLDDLDFQDLKAVHKLRLRCKSYRYLYERFAALASIGIARSYLSVRRLHRLLGDITDASYNVRALKRLFDPEDMEGDYLLSQALDAYYAMAEEQKLTANDKIQEVNVSPLKKY